jgi:hypothetical protein
LLCLQAVWEELPIDEKYGSRSREFKQRAFKQLVTAENPFYLHGFSDSSGDMEIKVPTICGEYACCQDAAARLCHVPFGGMQCLLGCCVCACYSLLQTAGSVAVWWLCMVQADSSGDIGITVLTIFAKHKAKKH